ncbi:MAG: rhomboid family intramembrane serine protease [Pseudomonadota bacterium]
MTVVISLLGLFQLPKIIDQCLFRPYWFLKRKQYDTVILSGFVHADLGHLAMNMITFYFFAFELERRLGTVPFVVLYVFGLIASSIYTWYRHHANPNYATLGASGAIAAVLFAYIVYEPFSTLMILPLPVPIPAFVFAFCYVGYSYWASKNAGGNINHDAHLWGAISGLIFVLLYDPSAYRALLNQF